MLFEILALLVGITLVFTVLFFWISVSTLGVPSVSGILTGLISASLFYVMSAAIIVVEIGGVEYAQPGLPLLFVAIGSCIAIFTFVKAFEFVMAIIGKNEKEEAFI